MARRSTGTSGRRRAKGGLAEVLAAMLAFTAAACSSQPPADIGAAGATTAADDELYRSLGGEAGIAQLVDRFLRNLAGDERVRHFFAETNIRRFRALLEQQFCVLAGGPCIYTGDSMAVAHRRQNISEADFNAVVENLWDAMEQTGLPVGAQNGLLAVLAPLREEIMGRAR